MNQSIAAAEAALKAGDTARAARHLESTVKRAPKFADGWLRLGQCYAELGRLRDAESAARRYLLLRPDSQPGLAILGVVLLDQARKDDARPVLERALRLEPADEQVLEALADLYASDLAWEKTAALLRPWSKKPDLDVESRLLLAESLFRTGDAAAGAEVADQLVSETRKPEAYLLAANCRVLLHQVDLALDLLEEGMHAWPEYEPMAERYASLRQDPAFAKHIEKRLKQLTADAGDIGEIVQLGRILTDIMPPSQNGPEGEAAERLLRRAVEVAPTDTLARYHLGRCLRLRRKAAEAVPVLETARGEGRLQVWILTELAQAEDDLSHADRAGIAFRAAMERNLAVHDANAALAYFNFLKRQGQTDAAGAVLDQVLAWDPMSVGVRLEKARRLASAQMWAQAIAEANWVLEALKQRPELARIAPDSVLGMSRVAHQLLAQCYIKVGDPERAKQHEEWLETPRP